MNYKKLIMSASTIAFVTALVIGGTGAFFNDTETSTGNLFTAGAIDLKIDSEQHYNGNVCTLIPANTDVPAHYLWVGNAPYPVAGTPCDGSWELADLNSIHKFFNFNDIKPGDEGENTISIHIDSNPAWMCADIKVTSNDDINCTDPENDAEGVGVCENSLPTPTFDGDLAQNINIFTWLDDGSVLGWQNSDEDTDNDDLGEGDNIWQARENKLFSNSVGPLSDAIGGKHYALADSGTGFGPLPAGLTQYIGLAWCAGTLDVSVPGTIKCDGALMDNKSQTDSTTLDMTFRVEQARNNEKFLCAPSTPAPVVTTLTLAKTVIPASTAPDSAFTLTATGSTSLSGIEGSPSVMGASVIPGTYTLGESGGPTGAVATWSCIGNVTPEVGNIVTIAAGETVTCDVTNNYSIQLTL